jgi:hypothetical protein
VEEIQHASFDCAFENVLTASAESSRHGATRGVSSQLGPKKNDTSRFKSQSLTAVEDRVQNTDHGRNRLPDGQKDTGVRFMSGSRRKYRGC